MAGFLRLLKENRNYRLTWSGQVVSEVGDNFNNIAVFALVMEQTHSGLAVSGVMLARAVAMLIAGPVAGVVLDRMDRRRVMVLSDMVRAVIALLFVLAVWRHSTPLLLLLSALLMFASPFFTSGRASILPVLASKERAAHCEFIDADDSVDVRCDRIVSWRRSVEGIRLRTAFVFNALSFLISAACIGMLRVPAGASFQAVRRDLSEDRVARPWHEYREGLRYMSGTPLILGDRAGRCGIGRRAAAAAQILFSLFGEVVFGRGAAGIGEVWGCAGIGLIAGGVLANTWGKRLTFRFVQVGRVAVLRRSRWRVRHFQSQSELRTGVRSSSAFRAARWP